MIEAVLFDLDQTLVDTSCLAALRRGRRWREAYASAARTRVYPGVKALWVWLRSAGYRVGVVTSSPSAYASAVLEAHGFVPDVLVAYHDTQQHKPHPAPLLLACARLGVVPTQAVYVGDMAADVEASVRCGMRSVGAGWGAEDVGALCTADGVAMEPGAVPAMLISPVHQMRRVV